MECALASIATTTTLVNLPKFAKGICAFSPNALSLPTVEMVEYVRVDYAKELTSVTMSQIHALDHDCVWVVLALTPFCDVRKSRARRPMSV